MFAQNNSWLHSPLPHGPWPGSYGGGRAGSGERVDHCWHTLTHFLRIFKDVRSRKMIKRPSRCCSYSAFSGWQSVWGVWTGDLGVLSCTWQPERQPCWCVLTENCRQGALFNPIWLTPPLPGSWEPARYLAGDDRLKETVGKYRVSKSDRPAALGWYVSHGLLDLGWVVWCDI